VSGVRWRVRHPDSPPKAVSTIYQVYCIFPQEFAPYSLFHR
jgi:hypothetical protein